MSDPGEIAAAVAEQLRPMLEPATLPEDIRAWFSELAKHGPFRYRFNVPGIDAEYGPVIEIKINPDGTAELTLFDMTMRPFWDIMLRGPVAGA